MERENFLSFNRTPCRFRLKNGKTIFGVIYEVPEGEDFRYFFSSLSEFQRSAYPIGQHIELDQVLIAEKLSEEAVAV